MKLNIYNFISIVFPLFILLSCKQEKQWKGQDPVKKVNTETVPIQFQHKNVFNLGNGIFCSNNFNGARLNGAALTKDSLITVLITPENTPVNASSWYAFKIWSDIERNVSVKLSYSPGYSHRYYPKLSRDGMNWEKVDTMNYNVHFDEQQKPVGALMKLRIGPDTLWISAQELMTTSHVEKWINKIESYSFATKRKIGESRAGKPIYALKVGESDDKNIILILSRQHPPEITGYMAMQAFVETICSENENSESFRNKYNTYVIPLANPDGVDNGHWRHNNGGIDLNRDWGDFNQPETTAIRDFMKHVVDSAGGKILFFIDFHSTWEDIYYVHKKEQKGKDPDLTDKLIQLTGNEFPNYTPNIKSLSDGSNTIITSDSYFSATYGAHALTYEVGDNTSRDFITKKGAVTAMKLMELLNNTNSDATYITTSGK